MTTMTTVIAVIYNMVVCIAFAYLTGCVLEIGVKDFMDMCKNDKGYALILAMIVLAGAWGYLRSWKVIMS